MAQNENIKNKFLTNLIKKGKKEQIEKKIQNLFFALKNQNNRKPLIFFNQIIQQNQPKLDIKKISKSEILKILKHKKQINKITKLLAENFNIHKIEKTNNLKLNQILELKRKDIYISAEKIKYNKIHKPK